MQEITSNTFYPFTVKQLMVFQEEIREAGGFEILMRHKESLQHKGGTWVIAMHDIEYYKNEYLIGVYEPLRDHYSTETPFTFWTNMFEMLSKAEKLL